MSMQALYDEVLDRYATELAAARADALMWWAGLVVREIGAGHDKAQAQHRCRMRWPMGPSSHPRVIEVYRRHFLEIGSINENFLEREDPERGLNDAGLWLEQAGADEEEGLVSQPATLLFESLGFRDPELQNFMRYFVFVPIGLDREGTWC
jgi:hypothetical protein